MSETTNQLCECGGGGWFLCSDAGHSDTAINGRSEVQRCDACSRYDNDDDALRAFMEYVSELERVAANYNVPLRNLRLKPRGSECIPTKKVRLERKVTLWQNAYVEIPEFFPDNRALSEVKVLEDDGQLDPDDNWESAEFGEWQLTEVP